jgi:hypothetical protein
LLDRLHPFVLHCVLVSLVNSALYWLMNTPFIVLWMLDMREPAKDSILGKVKRWAD